MNENKKRIEHLENFIFSVPHLMIVILTKAPQKPLGTNYHGTFKIVDGGGVPSERQLWKC